MSKLQLLILALMLAASGATTASATDAPPSGDCRTMAETLTKAVGIKLDIAEGPAPSPAGGSGKTCRMTGKTIGLMVAFDKAQDRIDAALNGWTHDVEQDADGPYSAVKQFRRGNQRLTYSLETEPPKGACKDDRPIGDCKAPRKRWIWTLEVSLQNPS